MSSLPTEVIAPLSSALTHLNPRQRLENTLAQLATTNTQLKNTDTAERKISTEELVEPIQRINEIMRPHGLEFELSEETSRVITRVVDRESGEVIRQIPAEEVLDIAKRLEEMQGRIISIEA
ncbi:flagellar protein FlaG [Halomonas sp. ISL-60]|uniref:flagellar protein FlaG n=1 Tax=unclassified Halomonas TaxID=2609666 RepID=UPI001BEBEFFD|nr:MULTISPECIES: flagellar protein FlaG [unclassified Halomonas]MBT2774545.1 flagellar protein FlaG [Halomonas sp. ISL-60]MBT2785904.1 flagellar protein FlaG [Halomonas sp. ISL-106]MBT2799194.1 flagellar protein FlaG [Halomonas sp. ISL-104]MBT2800386.1 flagellar protein FlaG [Halomonas sp. ISL-56]